MFFFIVISTLATVFYLGTLAGLVRTLESADAWKALLDCETPMQMWKSLTKLTRETIPQPSLSLYCPLKSFETPFRIPCELVFPDSQNTPALAAELPGDEPVTQLVAG